MIHVFKHGGAWVKDGIEYTVDVVPHAKAAVLLSEGWVKSFDELKNHNETVDGGDRERFLRDEIERISGKKPGPRSSIETLEAKYDELTEKQEDEH